MDKIRRERKNWFYSYNMIFDLDITVNATVVYLYLCRCADDQGEAFPSYNTIAKKCKISRRTAINAVNELKLIGLLTVISRKNPNYSIPVNTSNLYVVNDSPKLQSNISKSTHEELHQGGAGVVQELHQGGAGAAPKGLPIKGLHSVKDYPSIYPTNDGKDRMEEKAQEKALDSIAKNQAQNYLHNKINNHVNLNNIIPKNVHFDNLKLMYPNDPIIEDIEELLLDVLNSTNKTIRINGSRKNLDLVKSQFLKLQDEHIEYVLLSVRDVTTKIKNVRAYLLTTIYNSLQTINTYYSNRIKVDNIKEN